MRVIRFRQLRGERDAIPFGERNTEHDKSPRRETAVDSLTPEEYARFRLRLFERDWEKWDQEIAEDADTGRLDFLVHEAMEAKNGGKLRDL